LFLGNAVLFLLPLVVVVCFFMEMPWARPCLVLWVLPNVLRHGSIATLSSSSHYVAIRRGVVAEQNQILDHPMFWPLAIFSWNFGATHVMHHFLVKQPFWRRTLTFSAVREVMVENGVRANDLGTFRRANRYA
jgi:fatty acid desaturase